MAFLSRIILLLALATSGLSAPATRQIELRTGEAVEVSFAAGADVSVSRRGVVDLFHLGDGRWQITALHGGFVIVEAKANGEPLIPRLFVEVKAGDSEAEDLHLNAALGIPDWICQVKGIHCDNGAAIVTGTVPSYLWYRRAFLACKVGERCLFAAKLSDEALKAWVDNLRRDLGARFWVATSPAMMPSIEAYCGQGSKDGLTKEIDRATGEGLTAGLLTFHCRDDELHYRLSARIYLVEDAAARELGFSGEVSLQGTAPPFRTEAHLLTRLKALELGRRAELIGQPTLRLAPNREAEVQSGGEFQTITEARPDDHVVERASWKQHGLVMKLTASPVSPGAVRLAFDMSFKSKFQGGDTALTVNNVKSETTVDLGQQVMLAALDLKAQGREASAVSFISRMPIIGPLFSRAATQENSSRLLLWLCVNEDKDAADLKSEWPAATESKIQM